MTGLVVKKCKKCGKSFDVDEDFINDNFQGLCPECLNKRSDVALNSDEDSEDEAIEETN